MTPPSLVAAVPEELMTEFFAPDDRARLVAAAELLGGSFRRVDALADVPDTSRTRVVVTSWGAPPFTAELLAALPGLGLIAHTGASVRALVTDAVFDREVLITQAGTGMARSVAEVSLALTLALLHRVPRMHNALRDGKVWYQAESAGVQHEILDAPIAVVGASRTGRAYLELIRALGAEPLLVDPTLGARDAAALGAELAGLDEALTRARIVALHAPSLQATHRMLGARELALMPDGAGLVNTARSWLVDETALLHELQTGRIDAAIDVFDEEPLPAASPLRRLPNVLLTPHRAAGTREGRLRQGRIVAAEIDAFAQGVPLQHAVSRERLAVLA